MLLVLVFFIGVAVGWTLTFLAKQASALRRLHHLERQIDAIALVVDNPDPAHRDLKEKLDFILSSGVERTILAITEDLDAMVERTKLLRKRS